MIRHFLTIVSLLLVLQATLPALAESSNSPSSIKSSIVSSSDSINIKSDYLEAQHKNHLIVFKGNVVATRGNVTIHSDKLTVFYAGENKKRSEGESEEGSIEKVMAEGAVRIVQGNNVATGGMAEYFNREQKIILTGNPRVWQGKNFVQGARVIVYLQEERSVVEGVADNPVKATIHSKGSKKDAL